MRQLGIASVLAAVTMAGCESGNEMKWDREADGSPGVALVEMSSVTQVDNAVIRGCTVYPYHFVTGTATLTDLGRRDVRTLARHFRLAPGEVTIRRGGASEDLYTARVATVRDEFEGAGVAMDSVSMVDGLPGGEGLDSDTVLRALMGDQEGTEVSSETGAMNGGETQNMGDTQYGSRN